MNVLSFETRNTQTRYASYRDLAHYKVTSVLYICHLKLTTKLYIPLCSVHTCIILVLYCYYITKPNDHSSWRNNQEEETFTVQCISFLESTNDKLLKFSNKTFTRYRRNELVDFHRPLRIFWPLHYLALLWTESQYSVASIHPTENTDTELSILSTDINTACFLLDHTTERHMCTVL
jgi:hypothetical protein